MLKKLLITAFAFMIAIAAKADEGQKIPSKVQKVIVFLSGAQVTRTATVNINPGTSELVFDGIAPGLDEQSIQVHANGDFTILSVKEERNYLDAINDDARIKKVEELQALQKAVKDKMDMQNSMLSIYQNEEAILAKNQLIKSENESLDVVKLKQALDFQTERLTLLKEKEQAANNLIASLNAEIQKYARQIGELNNNRNIASTNIIVTVSSKNALQSMFTLSYLIHDASWYASYDIRAKDVNSPLTIAYKANVAQRSGEDWKNVKLTLSTGTPTSNNVKPDLNPYYLSFDLNTYNNRPSSNSLAEVVVTGYGTEKKEDLSGAVSGVAVSTVENQTTVEFNIDNTWSILSDGKPNQVEINQVSLKADYQYYVAPKVSRDVFLTARVTDWNKYNFLSGEANLFFEGTYVGKSKLDTRTMNDTLNLSLGVDKNILVKRILEKSFTEKPALSSNIKDTRNWLIEVRNRKNQPINLLVEDQVPVSQNALIEVEVQDTGGAKPDATSGKVSWNFLLTSQENKQVRLKYDVKYPKNHGPVIVQ
jgi:uncharacterized protein (TIGR02231 family)